MLKLPLLKAGDIVKCVFSPARAEDASGSFTSGTLYTVDSDFFEGDGIVRIRSDDEGEVNGWSREYFKAHTRYGKAEEYVQGVWTHNNLGSEAGTGDKTLPYTLIYTQQAALLVRVFATYDQLRLFVADFVLDNLSNPDDNRIEAVIQGEIKATAIQWGPAS